MKLSVVDEHTICAIAPCCRYARASKILGSAECGLLLTNKQIKNRYKFNEVHTNKKRALVQIKY